MIKYQHGLPDQVHYRFLLLPPPPPPPPIVYAGDFELVLQKICNTFLRYDFNELEY